MQDPVLRLLGELVAQRDDFKAWQDDALRRLCKVVEGQPEVQVGQSVLSVVEAYVARLRRERDAATAEVNQLRRENAVNGAAIHQETVH